MYTLMTKVHIQYELTCLERLYNKLRAIEWRRDFFLILIGR